MRRLHRTWTAVRWPLLGALAATSLVLGWFGFRAHAEATGQPLGVLSAAYRSLQLFVLEFGAAEPPSAPAILQVARVLAPAVAGYAAAAALAALFRDEFDRWTLRWRRGHVVVCGHGSQGRTLVDALVAAGHPVASVEIDPSRRGAVPTICGDATDPGVLRAAGVARAAHVVALCGTDEANAAVALAVRDVAGGGDRPVTHVHVLDPRLCAVLRSEALASGAALEFFTVYEHAARTLLDRHPPTPAAGERPSAAILGLGRLGRSVLLEAVRRHPGIRITAIDLRAAAILESIRRRRPGFAAGCEIAVVDIDAGSPAFEEAGFLTGGGACEVDVVYVCLSDEGASLTAALAIHHRLRAVPCRRTEGPVDVVARVTRPGGLADLVARTTGDGAVRFHTFDVYRATLDERLLTGATREAIAAALHREYLAVQTEAGREPGDAPSLRPWDELDEETRDANRAAAAAVGPRLRAVGADLVPLAWQADPLEFTPAEVELLAILEHRRWLLWKLDHGFRRGPAGSRANPYLVPWGELDENAREWVRSFARALPRVLADAGQQVIRLDRGTARSLHEEYLRMHREAGEGPDDNPSMVPWEQLPEPLRASNRDQAAHIRVKLLSIGLDAAPGPADPAFAFTDQQVEHLARMEHDRWVAHRRFDGWTEGPRKDAATRVTPHLVPWEGLDEKMRDVDRAFVRSIPAVLASLGMRIVPDPEAATGA